MFKLTDDWRFVLDQKKEASDVLFFAVSAQTDEQYNNLSNTAIFCRSSLVCLLEMFIFRIEKDR